MRVWHKSLIPILPKQQLVGQWRECSLISKCIAVNGTPNHILVNKVIDYPLEHFATYCYMIAWQLGKRGYVPSIFTENSIQEHLGVRLEPFVPEDVLFMDWHNDRYLWQCLSNLEEKYDCGGIPEDEWVTIDNYISEML